MQTQNLQTSYIPVFPQDFKDYVVEINYPRTQTHFVLFLITGIPSFSLMYDQ